MTLVTDRGEDPVTSLKILAQEEIEKLTADPKWAVEFFALSFTDVLERLDELAAHYTETDTKDD